MKLITGYEFWWTPSFCSVIHLKKFVFLSKFSNPPFRNRLPFYRKFPRNAKIVLRCCRSEHDGSFNSSLTQERLKIVTQFLRNRTPIFYETTCLDLASWSYYDVTKLEEEEQLLFIISTIEFCFAMCQTSVGLTGKLEQLQTGADSKPEPGPNKM